VSIIQISKNKFDAGPILWQKELALQPETTFKSASFDLAQMGGEGLYEVLTDFEHYKA